LAALIAPLVPTLGSAQTSQPSLSSPVAASVRITAEHVSTIPPNFIGIKFGKSEMLQATQLFTANNVRAVDNFKALSPLPGQSCVLSIGSDGGKETWVPNGPGRTAGQLSQVDIQALAAFLKAAKCQVDYGIALTGNTPAAAASEAAYVAQELGSNLLAIGFGNEPDGTGVTAAAYAAQWNTFATAALANDENLKFKGPETGIASNLGTWLTAWYQANSKLPLAYGSQHFYVNGPAGCSQCNAANMLADRDAEGYWTAMVLQKNIFEAGLATPLPVALTETNNFYSGGAPGVSNSYASALYAFDFALRAAASGFSAAVFTGGDNWSQGYSPLNVVDGTTWGPKLEYYGLYMAALTGYGPMLSTTVTGTNGVHAYTVNSNNGTNLNIALVNTTATNYDMSVTLPAGTNTSKCTSVVLSDSNGLMDTSGSGVHIQGGQFSTSSAIDLEAPYAVPVTSGVAAVAVPSYSGVLVSCPVTY
jgi:hypothetical protein